MIKFENSSFHNKMKSVFEKYPDEVLRELENRGIGIKGYSGKDNNGLIYQLLQVGEYNDDDDSGHNKEFIIKASTDISFTFSNLELGIELGFDDFLELLKSITNAEVEGGYLKINQNYYIPIVGCKNEDNLILHKEIEKRIAQYTEKFGENDNERVERKRNIQKNSHTRPIYFQESQVRISILSYLNEYCIYRMLNEKFEGELYENSYVVKVENIEKVCMAEEVFQAYIYSLNVSKYPIALKKLFKQNKSNVEYEYVEEDDDTYLDLTKGSREIYKLYNKALAANTIEMKIFQLSKILEYVGSSLVEKEKIKELTLKLAKRDRAIPSADYVKEILDKLNTINKKYLKDEEIIKSAVFAAFDFSDAKNYEYVKLILGSTLSEIELKKKIFNAILETRNQIAHAKANYQVKDNECDIDKNGEIYINMLTDITIKAINVYLSIEERFRVTNERIMI